MKMPSYLFSSALLLLSCIFHVGCKHKATANEELGQIRAESGGGTNGNFDIARFELALVSPVNSPMREAGVKELEKVFANNKEKLDRGMQRFLSVSIETLRNGPTCTEKVRVYRGIGRQPLFGPAGGKAGALLAQPFLTRIFRAAGGRGKSGAEFHDFLASNPVSISLENDEPLIKQFNDLIQLQLSDGETVERGDSLKGLTTHDFGFPYYLGIGPLAYVTDASGEMAVEPVRGRYKYATIAHTAGASWNQGEGNPVHSSFISTSFSEDVAYKFAGNDEDKTWIVLDVCPERLFPTYNYEYVDAEQEVLIPIFILPEEISAVKVHTKTKKDAFDSPKFVKSTGPCFSSDDTGASEMFYNYSSFFETQISADSATYRANFAKTCSSPFYWDPWLKIRNGRAINYAEAKCVANSPTDHKSTVRAKPSGSGTSVAVLKDGDPFISFGPAATNSGWLAIEFLLNGVPTGSDGENPSAFISKALAKCN
jgi:hypothetical protein